jgi:hypothetical protein
MTYCRKRFKRRKKEISKKITKIKRIKIMIWFMGNTPMLTNWVQIETNKILKPYKLITSSF